MLAGSGGGVVNAGRAESHKGTRILAASGSRDYFGGRLSLLLGGHVLLSQFN